MIFHISQCVCLFHSVFASPDFSCFFLFHLLLTVGFILSVQCSLVAIEVSSHMPFGLWVDVCRSSFAVRRSPFVVHRSSFALCIRRSSFVVRICRSTFADHRSVIIFSIPLSFIICVRSSIGVNLLCSCFAPPLLSRLGNIIVLLLIIGFAAFAMFDVPIFTIFARLGCFCKDFRVGYSLLISIWCSAIFISGLYNNSY